MDNLAEQIVATVVPVVPNTEEEKTLAQQVNLTKSEAVRISISSDEDYTAAASFVKDIKNKAAEVKGFFKPMKESASQAHKAACAAEKKLLDPLVEAEGSVKRSMSAYVTEKERKRREIEEKLRKQAEAEAAAALEKAVQQEAQGFAEAAQEAMREAEITESVAKSVSVAAETPKVKGVSTSIDYEITGINQSLVPVAVNDVVIRPVDEKAILRLIRESKGTIKIQGVQYAETTRMSIRR